MAVKADAVPRLFVPSADPDTESIPSADLLVYNKEKQVSQLVMKDPTSSRPIRNENSLVIRVDGSVRNQGEPNARASYGVYLGSGSRHNANGLLPPSVPQNSVEAEIEALDQGLHILHKITESDSTLSRVVIGSDSESLVQSISERMEGWIEKGGRNNQGKHVVHFERLKQLYNRLDELERGGDEGICIQLWHISKSQNQGADKLASDALV